VKLASSFAYALKTVIQRMLGGSQESAFETRVRLWKSSRELMDREWISRGTAVCLLSEKYRICNSRHSRRRVHSFSSMQLWCLFMKIIAKFWPSVPKCSSCWLTFVLPEKWSLSSDKAEGSWLRWTSGEENVLKLEEDPRNSENRSIKLQRRYSRIYYLN